MHIALVRCIRSEQGTFGILAHGNRPLCVTLEDPWRLNKPNESCIPGGKTYRCKKHTGPKYQNVWEITGVPGRTAILIHNGNTILDTQGCVLCGRGFGMIGDLPSITDSRATLDMLRTILPAEFDLSIIA